MAKYLYSDYCSTIINNDGCPINYNLHKELNFENPEKKSHEKHRDTIPSLVREFKEKCQERAYVGIITPSKRSHAIIPMTRLMRISPQIM